MSKVKVIKPRDRRSLDKLDLNPGDFVGFDNRDVEMSQPFLVAIVGKGGLKKGNFSKDPNDFVLRHCSQKEAQDWILNTEGGAIELRPPKPHKIFNIFNFNIYGDTNRPYFVEYAYVGEAEIVNGLRNSKGLEVYAAWFKSEVERLKEGR